MMEHFYNLLSYIVRNTQKKLTKYNTILPKTKRPLWLLLANKLVYRAQVVINSKKLNYISKTAIRKVFRKKSTRASFRKEVKNKIKQVCFNCGCTTKKKLTRHHIVPIEERPELAIVVENIVMLCKTCHDQFHKDCDEAKKELVKR